MAISTPSHLADTQSSSGSSITTASITPTGDALLVVIWTTLGGVLRTHDSISQGFSISGSWTKRVEQTYSNSGNGRISIWTARAAASPGSGTVTCNWSGNNTSNNVSVIEVASGWDTTSPITQTVSGSASTSTSPSITFGASPASDAMLIGGIQSYGSSAGGVTPGSGWTELYDVSSTAARHQGQYVAGSNGSTVDWSGLTSPANIGMAAIEIAAEAAGEIEIGQVVETDTAQPFSVLKEKVIGQIAEADTAQSMSVSTATEFGQVTEADTAQALAGSAKEKEIGQTTETDTSQPIAASTPGFAPIGQVVETDTAQPLAGSSKSKEISQVTEADTAQPMTSARGIDIGQTTETDTAQVIDIATARLVRQVTETDTALPMDVDGGSTPSAPAQGPGGGGFHRVPRRDAWRAIDARRGRQAGKLTDEEKLQVDIALEDQEIMAIIEIALKYIA